MKALLLMLSLAVLAVALVPDAQHSHHHRSSLSPPSTTQLHVSATLAEVAATKKLSQERKINKKRKSASEEHRWLNWIYKQWIKCPVGNLSGDVLKNMVPAISHWARRKEDDAPDRAEELLERIIQENLAHNHHAVLTITMFNSAMNAYSKRGDPTGVQRILRRMEYLRANNAHLAHLKPDVFSMSTLATAWAKSKSPEAALKAQSILEYMEVKKLNPNTITYNAVLSALAQGNQVDKAIRAEDIVDQMKERSEANEDCRPDIYSYQSLIQAWAKTSLPGSPQKAEQILRYMDEEAEKGQSGLSPNVYCFTTTINAWAKSSEKNRARSAYALLQHMRKRYMENLSNRVKPNVVAFTAVLNACSFPLDEREREDCFKIAQLTMAELSLGIYDKPNFLSYASFLAVCTACLDEGEYRDKVVEGIFSECVQKGQVGNIVVRKLQKAASPVLFHRLVGEYQQDDGTFKIPRLWSICAKGERKAVPSAAFAAGRANDYLSNAGVKTRLKVVQSYGGQSGVYSSGSQPQRLEAEGISFSTQPLGS